MAEGRLIPNREASTSNRPTKGELMAAKMPGQMAFDPPPPRGAWSDEVVTAYDAFWSDVSASATREVDVVMVMRYFDLQELISRLWEQVIEDQLLTETNAGSLQTHPHVSMIARLTSTSIKLANEIGATPWARLKLGLTKVEGQRALAELEKRLSGQVTEQVKQVQEEERREDDEVVEGEVVEW